MLGVVVAPNEDARAVSLHAMERHLAMIQTIEDGLGKCCADSPGLALFGGENNFVLSESKMPPPVAVQREIL